MGNPLDPGEGPSTAFVDNEGTSDSINKSNIPTDTFVVTPNALPPEDDTLFLSDLGVVQHDHDVLEDKITRKIELKSDLATIAKELDILIKRKELNQFVYFLRFVSLLLFDPNDIFNCIKIILSFIVTYLL